MALTPGERLLKRLNESEEPLPVIGIYDLFSATVVAKHFDGFFLSGFGFAASYYGLPDIGFIAWTDIVAWTQRVRALFPFHHIVVDIDDGYTDPETACHVVSLLESAGASAVVLEDQKRPRKCGHFDGKQIMELDEFMVKLKKVLEVRKKMVVVARTDTSDFEDMRKRARAFHEAGADVILVDGLKDLNYLAKLKQEINTKYMFNQIAGGKSPPCTLTELKNIGVRIVNYSTPCLFAAQKAMDDTLIQLKKTDGKIEGGISVAQCSKLLFENVERRDSTQ
jgi:2-methylisocitrate lyase-like PEP mutase family enzyme